MVKIVLGCTVNTVKQVTKIEGSKMKSTIRLFGQPKSRYEPCLTELATMRIEDGKELLKELARLRDVVPKDELDDLVVRYQETEAAVRWWQGLLLEED